MNSRLARYVIVTCFLRAASAVAADHLIGSVDLQYYAYTLEIDSYAAWDYEPDPFAKPPVQTYDISGTHQISQVTSAQVHSYDIPGSSFLRGPAWYESCYTGSLDIHSTTWTQFDMPNFAGPHGYWSYYLCSPPQQSCPPPTFEACLNDQWWPSSDPCDPCTSGLSPILISFEGGEYQLCGPADPVTFDILADGQPEQITWTQRGFREGFLALDRNNNGAIDNSAELFGNHTPLADGQPPPRNSNGYLALASYDLRENGGNADGHIGPEDAVWSRLRIWIDENHDGVSQSTELLTMEQAGITRIDQDYELVNRTDRYGNLFRYKGKATIVGPNGVSHVTPTYDVYFKRTGSHPTGTAGFSGSNASRGPRPPG